MSRDRLRVWGRMTVLTSIALGTAAVFVTSDRLDQLYQLVGVWFLVPGAIVVVRRDGNIIGWLLVTQGFLWMFQSAVETPGTLFAWMSAPWLAWCTDWVGYASWAVSIALFVLFPDGLADRTPRQRRVGILLIATGVLGAVSAMLLTQVGVDSVHGVHDNPTGLGVLPPAVGQYAIVMVGLAGLSSVIGLWRRSRQVSGVARRQYKLVVSAFAVVVVGLVLGLTLSTWLGDAAWLIIILGWVLIPTAFSVAILRHGLYDIDRIISRTVAYAIITAIVAGIYGVVVVTLPEVFGLRGPLPVAMATLVAAGAFSPVRRLVQDIVDRRFNREHVDARRELDAYAARLRSQVDLDAVIAGLSTLVDTTLHPDRMTVWIRPPATRP